ncbi:MAG: neutral zinc metallopeptidase [Aeromicrobium sp.]|nr:neutral zinc metallopeptidase [Burkholderiales bacterium]
MRLDNERESENVEDRRGSGVGIGTIGVGTTVVALIASYFLGIDPRVILGLAETVQEVRQSAPANAKPIDPATDPEAALKREMARVLAKTEDTWSELFQQMGNTYQKPKLVLYTGVTPTSCGKGQAAMGPFYCPGDQKVYLDMSFFRELSQRFHASGDFARAYVIAHEIGHHVQNQLGVMEKTNAMRARMSQTQNNMMSVRVELQADCLAGVWAFQANRKKPFLDTGDVEAALAAATAIGDDALQRQSRGEVVPDSFTHGTSAQRVRWFKAGLDGGTIKACDTFNASTL